MSIKVTSHTDGLYTGKSIDKLLIGKKKKNTSAIIQLSGENHFPSVLYSEDHPAVAYCIHLIDHDWTGSVNLF